jgi:hypothetical protein
MVALTWVHRGSSLFATALIVVFLTATVSSELLGSLERVAQVKQLIVLPGLWLLVPAIAAAVITGNLITRGRKGRLLRTKKLRSLAVAATGILILVPAALTLRALSLEGSFGTSFYAIQSIELLAGASNLVLLGLNIYDGRRLAGRMKPSKRILRS